jgi:hypothetical protein
VKIVEDILYGLVHLPKSLPDLYQIAFEQIFELGRASYRLALCSLQLLSAAVRPLHWGEFLYLISCSKTILGREPSKSEILDTTYNFLEDDRVESRPKFVHLSAKEYLDSRQEFIPAVSNMVAAVTCLDSLSVNWNLTTQNYTYATLYLGNHLTSTTPDHRLPFREGLKQCLVLDLEKVEFESHLFINLDRATSWLPRLFIIWRERIGILYKKGLLRMSMVDSADMCLASLV